MIKRLLLILMVSISVISCSGYNNAPYIVGGILVEYEDYVPDDESGILPSGLTKVQVEQILFGACAKTKWKIMDSSDGVMFIRFKNSGVTVYSKIVYTNEKYVIQFSEWEKTKIGFPGSCRYYTRLVNKLNNAIQKQASLVL